MTATLPLHSCRMFASWLGRGDDRFGGRDEPVDDDGPGLRTAVETDAASGAVVAGITRRMHPVGTQFRGKLQAFGRAGFHAQPASFALLDINRDIAACWTRHISPPPLPHLVTAVCAACGCCNHLVFSQYSYSSLRKSGCAISMSALARSRMDLPCRYAIPYSVTM